MKLLEGVLVAADVDGTIVENDTIFDFFEKYGMLEEAKAINEISPGADVSAVLRKIAAQNELDEGDFVKIADDAKIFAGAKEFFAKMQLLGCRVCLLTATYEPIARRVAGRLELENAVVCATRLAKSNGRIVGVEGRVMDAGEKRRALEIVCRRESIKPGNVVGIADSENDAPFMELVEENGGLCLWKPEYASLEKKVAEWAKRRGRE